MSILTNGYTYDYAGRLASEVSDDLSTTEYGYDARGNLLSVLKTGFSTSSIYSGDVLTSVTSAINGAAQTVSFVHDALGRMTYDGTTGQAMTYNTLDLIGKVSKGGTVLANYSYLSDGTKLSALDGSGEGLVYRGPFVYRKSSGSSSLTLESAVFGGGRLTPNGAMLYVTDYLGSVRVVVNGATGAIYKASDYSPYGEQSDAESMQTASTPAWITLRDAYTGQEDQHPDFGTGYTNFGARQYSPALRRWMTTDPLSEKYYGISPYAFCNDNPLRYVDPDGRDGIYINFPDYVICVGNMQFENLGHSGILLINNQTGLTKYYEYGRYDKQNIGIVRNIKVPNVVIGEDGRPEKESLDKVFGAISQIAGDGGKIEGAYVESNEFEALNDYAQSLMTENENPEREPYNIMNNNCSTFAEDVLKQDRNIEKKAPISLFNIPNSVVKKWQNEFIPISFNNKIE